eukprot:715732-Prorocentrum_minimum.AAC.1
MTKTSLPDEKHFVSTREVLLPLYVKGAAGSFQNGEGSAGAHPLTPSGPLWTPSGPPLDPGSEAYG